jgi:hypothetical protein
MKIKKYIRTLLLACLLVGSNMVYADDDLDVTMRMVPPDVELPDAVTKVITLPPHTPDNAKTNAQKGLDTANEARGKSRDLDIETPQMPQIPQVDLPEQARGRGRH